MSDWTASLHRFGRAMAEELWMGEKTESRSRLLFDENRQLGARTGGAVPLHLRKPRSFFYVAQSQTTISHMAVWIKLANQYNRGSIFILECRVNFLSPRDNTNGQAIPCKLFFGLNVWNCCLLVCSLVYVEIVMRPWPRMNRVLVRMFLQLWNSYQGTPVTKLTKCEAILSVWNSKSKFSFAFPFHEPELCSHVNISMG